MLWLLSLAAGAVGLLITVVVGLFRIGGPLHWRLLLWSVLLAIALASAWLLVWANLASMMGCISLPQRGALALLNMAPAELLRRLAGYFGRVTRTRFGVNVPADEPGTQ